MTPVVTTTTSATQAMQSGAVQSGLAAGLDALPVGVAIWNGDRALIYCNRMMRQILPSDIHSGQAFDEFIAALAHSGELHLDDPAGWSQMVSGGFGGDLSLDVLTAEGQTLNLVLRGDQNGGSVLSLTDITAFRHTEQELREARDDAEATDEAKSRFLRAANHDLRQPMASLKILIYNCLRETDEEARAEILHAMGVATSIMEDLLGALLQIGQLDAGRIRPRVTSFQVSQLFERLDIQFRHQAEAKGLRLRFVPSRHAVATDRALLERILGNFVANAVRFTEVGGIVIGCRKEGRAIRFEIVDTGRGIAPEDQTRIFDEFYRTAEARSGEKSGLGLGLNIVRRLADLLEHPVRLRSVPGRGSIFSVTAPAGNIWHSQLRDVDISESIGGEFADVNVLLVEDDGALRRNMTTLLERWGVNVLAAADEAEAHVLAQSGAQDAAPVRLIVADYNLGRRTGVDLIADLRARLGPQLPAMIVTADASPDVVARIREAGLPFLIKPASPPRLRVLMHNLLFEPTLLNGAGS